MDNELATNAVLSPTCNLSKDGDIVRRWMDMVLGDKFLGDFPAVLQSGELLCDLVNKLYKALGMKTSVSPVRGVDGCDDDALSNVLEYLRACEALGVARRDLFEPDDLLQRKDMEKVYGNILALQTVAVSLSNRRSIDERSSMINQPDGPSMAEHGIFVDDDDDLDADLDLESPGTVHMHQQLRWQQLLVEYEHQQEQKEKRDRAGDSSASDGIGPLAHGIWRTEERIRAILMRDDRDFGAVPDELHGKLWMLTSGAQMEMRKNKGQYERLLASESTSTEATRQIDVDLHRTVAEEDKELWTEEKSSMMRRVLVAYSFYNPSLGYCQGLNYIVARILQYLGEEEAFYLLIEIIRLVPDDYYTTMLGLAVDQHVFADLVRLQYPEVSEHLSELGGSGMELSLACTEWFLTLFASPCDREVTFQIWDAIFLLGDEILFRVALALLQQAKSDLVACDAYGDMLKHLNELGRGKIDAVELIKVSKKQDCVIRDRVEDFRAHHRLQLASGIVASTVDAEDVRSSSIGRRSSEYRSEPRLRIFGRKKQGIFRHIDKIPPRLARTFDRTITEEYMESIRREHPHHAKYYEGMQPQITEDHWGSAESSCQWGDRNVRRVLTDDCAVSSKQENDDHHMKYDSSMLGRHTSPNRPDANEYRVGLVRDRRSKSSAFVHAKKSSSDYAINTLSNRLGKDNDEDAQLNGRSPLAWIHRFEEWKHQKERKKAERKRLRRNHRFESILPGTSDEQAVTWLRDVTDPSQAPLYPQSQKVDGTDNVSLGHLNGYEHPSAENIAILEGSSLSRSSSDPFRSPTDIAGQSQRQVTAEEPRQDAEQRPKLPQHPFKREGDEAVQKAEIDEARNLARSGSGRPSRGLSDQSTLSRSTANTASFTLDPLDVATLAQEERPLAHEILYSPVQYRSGSLDFTIDSCAPPHVRRITSIAADGTCAQQKRVCHSKRAKDCSHAMRERANVLQYMHRKASDASSVAGSIPRSPARISESSSDSSRFGDQTSNRSSKSTQFRKSSFSFFDKLSSDLETSTHGLDNLLDEAEFKTEGIGRVSVSSVATDRSSIPKG